MHTACSCVIEPGAKKAFKKYKPPFPSFPLHPYATAFIQTIILLWIYNVMLSSPFAPWFSHLGNGGAELVGSS